MSGISRIYLNPERPTRAIDGLLTGLHDTSTSHIQLLRAITGDDDLQSAYHEAIGRGYLWHEFGDSHLILK